MSLRRAGAYLRLPWVLLLALFWVLQGYATMRLRFPQASEAQRQAMARAWARRLLRLFGLRLEQSGTAPVQGPLMVVANHISWLDILVLLAAAPVQFVSREENKHWPILGWMTQQAGAVFVQRSSSRDMAKAVAQVSHYLAQEACMVAVFPEGQTSTGEGVAAFHGNLLQAAMDADAPIQVAALDYRHAATGARSTAPTYAGLSLLQSVINTLAGGPYVVHLAWGPALPSAGHSRKRLAAHLREQVQQLRGDA